MDRKSFAAQPLARKAPVHSRWSAVLALGSIAFAAHAAAAPSYTCELLGNSGGSVTMTADALNNLGQVVGNEVVPVNRTFAVHWNKQGQITTTYSGPNGADWTEPAGINDAGMVAGTGTANYTGPNARAAAYVWVNGQTTLLPGYEEGQTFATGINKSGQVSGERYVVDSAAQATVWTGGQAVALPPLVAGVAAYTTGISDRGDVAGESGTATPGITHAVRWRDGVAIELNVLRGMEEARATAISATGTIVGTSWKPGVTRAVTWIGRKAKVLPVPPHTPEAMPQAINKRGEIVGRFGFAEPAYWASADTTAVNVNDLLVTGCHGPDGQRVDLWHVNDINDHGVMVGQGYWTPHGGSSTGLAFKLVPQVGQAESR